MLRGQWNASGVVLALVGLAGIGGCPAIPSSSNGSLVVDAGSDQTIVWPLNSVTLTGQVSSTGQSSSLDRIDLSWDVDADASTDTNVLFADPEAAETTVSFAGPGTYVLVLTATDGRTSATDTVTVTVAAPSWNQQAEMVPDDGAEADNFGNAVAIDGNVCVIGAAFDDDRGTDSGAAYVFVWDGSTWNQQAKLLPDEGSTAVRFGASVAIDGDWIVVGAPWDRAKGSMSGAVYVFHWDGAQWTRHAKLVAGDETEGDNFGTAVAISGNRLVATSPLDVEGGLDTGSAYIFEHSGEQWAQTDKFVPDDAEAGDQFGQSAAIDGDWIVIGAGYDDAQGTDSGSAYVFNVTDGRAIQVAKLLPSDGTADDRFGVAVAISGDRVAVGAHLHDYELSEDSGAAYIFRASGDQWVEETRLMLPEPGRSDQFGVSVAMTSDRVVVGAPGDDSNGAAYVFRYDAGQWVMEGLLQPSDRELEDGAGNAVAISTDAVVIGSPRHDDAARDSGAAYIFRFVSGP